MSPVGTIFVPFPPKTGTNMLHPRPSAIVELVSCFPRRYVSFGVMAVGTNGLTCGFNWQFTADAIGYAVMITAILDSLPSRHSLPRFGSTTVGRQPGRAKMKSKIHSFSVLSLFCLFVSLIYTAAPPTARLPSYLWSLRIFPSIRGSLLRVLIAMQVFSRLTPRQQITTKFYFRCIWKE